MKKTYYLAVAALAVVSCSQDEFTGMNLDNAKTEEITFAMSAPAINRASITGDEAAEKLGGEFVVYGWKTVDAAPSDVFQNYTVTWNGKAGESLSNTSGWEYVGNMSQPLTGSPVEQSIKYWDFKASQYDFIAWRTLGDAKLKAIKTLTADERKEGETPNYYKEKALHFEPQTITEAGGIYIANQVTVQKANFQKEVELSFRNLAAKVRVGIYETVSGYSVKDVKFYQSASESSSTTTATLFTTTNQFISKANVDVKYRTSNNEAVVASTPISSAKFVGLGTFTGDADPEYRETGKFVGRSSNAATYAQGAAGDGWNLVFPNTATDVLNLRVDYTLVSKEGSGEVIHVSGATAVVPAQYADWKANYAYTYLFKITDKTNGKTDPSQPTEGLFPIQFDAVVVATETGNTEETITTISNASITTYQNGSAVTSDNEYKAGNIYVSVAENGGNVELKSDNIKLYTALNLDNSIPLTEANVANYKNNGILLTDVTTSLTLAKEITETMDGVNIPFDGTTSYVAKFNATDNKVYVVEYINSSTKSYKVIKVGGAPSATYTLTPAAESVAEGGNVNLTVKEDGNAVTGAQNFFVTDAFDVEETATPGTYKLTAKAGTSGEKTVTLNGQSATITVKAYEFASAGVEVTAGESATATLKLAGEEIADLNVADNFEVTEGFTITEVEKGVVTFSAAKTAKDGTIQFKNGGVVVAEATITVNNYSFTTDKAVVNIGGVGETDNKATLTLKLKDVVAPEKDVTLAAATGVATLGANKTDVNGQVTLTAGTTVGTAKVSAPDDSFIEIEVKNFAVTFYSDEACTTPATPAADGTCYVKFTDNGVANNASIAVTAGTLTSTSTVGVFKYVAPASGAAAVTYTYNGVTFTLFSATFGE